MSTLEVVEKPPSLGLTTMPFELDHNGFPEGTTLVRRVFVAGHIYVAVLVVQDRSEKIVFVDGGTKEVYHVCPTVYEKQHNLVWAVSLLDNLHIVAWGDGMASEHFTLPLLPSPFTHSSPILLLVLTRASSFLSPMQRSNFEGFDGVSQAGGFIFYDIKKKKSTSLAHFRSVLALWYPITQEEGGKKKLYVYTVENYCGEGGFSHAYRF